MNDIPSIIQKEERCFLCGSTVGLTKHHIFEGSYRNFSVRYGIWIWLDWLHHHYIQTHEEEMQKLRAYGQTKAMEYYGWSMSDWMNKCGRSFL